MTERPGLYIHVPFCVSKCPYCDFYSVTDYDDALLDAYTAAVIARLEALPTEPVDTVYFGGGTPSLLGGRRLTALLDAIARTVGLCEKPEITLEANPADDLAETLAAFAAAGGNRLSLGMQAHTETGLRSLGRRHTPEDLRRTLTDARVAGLHNLSLDMMLATPGQTPALVTAMAAACAAYGAAHVSAYLLKIEPGTPFARQTPALPDDDAAASLYLTACEALEREGYGQYEISNFARPGCESRHNLKYWTGAPYYGIGPAAHAFFEGRRWKYSRSLRAFLQGEPPVPEEAPEDFRAGSPEEYGMLRLRLVAGVTEADYAARFGTAIPAVWRQRAAVLPPRLIVSDDRGIRLTREGFLVSNALLRRILWP